MDFTGMAINFFALFDAAYRAYLERLGYALMEEYWGDNQEENETDEEETDEESSDDDDFIPDGMLMATPDNSDSEWGDELDELPSMDDFLYK